MELFRSNTAVQGMPRNSSIVNQTGPWSQVMIGLLVPFVIYLLLAGLEASYNFFNRLKMNRTELLPITYSTEGKSYTIIQNPNLPNSASIYLSDNERSGPEFSYNFFLMVHPSAFRQEKGLNHIFHKGSPKQYPLLGPGVYMRSDTNTLRVYMNTYKTWNKYAEVDNFPIGKWVHVALVCRSTHMEIYINGNLKKRLGFDGSLPYQNYQNIMAFSQDRITLPRTIPSLEDEDSFDVFGIMKGMLSRLYYFNYALSYSEITMLMNEGPSTEIAGAQGGVMPQYLQDSWWTSQ